MGHEWYYTQGDRKIGPIPETELKQLAASGQLSATDLVWRDGMADWRAAGSVKGLLPKSVGGPPPVPGGASRGALPSAEDAVARLAERVKFLDLKFQQFATPHLIGVVFALALVVLLISFVYWTDHALTVLTAKKAAFAIVGLVIAHGFLAVCLRVFLELCVVVFRIAEHLSHLRHLGDNREAK